MIRSLLQTLIIMVLTVFLACEKKTIPSDIIMMQIADCYKNCTGEGSRKCLQVKINDAPNYSYFYNSIEGFDYEEGYAYKLLVKREKINNPPVDGSSIRYIFVELISRIKT